VNRENIAFAKGSIPRDDFTKLSQDVDDGDFNKFAKKIRKYASVAGLGLATSLAIYAASTTFLAPNLNRETNKIISEKPAETSVAERQKPAVPSVNQDNKDVAMETPKGLLYNIDAQVDKLDVSPELKLKLKSTELSTELISKLENLDTLPNLKEQLERLDPNSDLKPQLDRLYLSKLEDNMVGSIADQLNTAKNKISQIEPPTMPSYDPTTKFEAIGSRFSDLVDEMLAKVLVTEGGDSQVRPSSQIQQSQPTNQQRSTINTVAATPTTESSTPAGSSSAPAVSSSATPTPTDNTGNIVSPSLPIKTAEPSQFKSEAMSPIAPETKTVDPPTDPGATFLPPTKAVESSLSPLSSLSNSPSKATVRNLEEEVMRLKEEAKMRDKEIKILIDTTERIREENMAMDTALKAKKLAYDAEVEKTAQARAIKTAKESILDQKAKVVRKEIFENADSARAKQEQLLVEIKEKGKAEIALKQELLDTKKEILDLEASLKLQDAKARAEAERFAALARAREEEAKLAEKVQGKARDAIRLNEEALRSKADMLSKLAEAKEEQEQLLKQAAKNAREERLAIEASMSLPESYTDVAIKKNAAIEQAKAKANEEMQLREAADRMAKERIVVEEQEVKARSQAKKAAEVSKEKTDNEDRASEAAVEAKNGLLQQESDAKEKESQLLAALQAKRQEEAVLTKQADATQKERKAKESELKAQLSKMTVEQEEAKVLSAIITNELRAAKMAAESMRSGAATKETISRQDVTWSAEAYDPAQQQNLESSSNGVPVANQASPFTGAFRAVPQTGACEPLSSDDDSTLAPQSSNNDPILVWTLEPKYGYDLPLSDTSLM